MKSSTGGKKTCRYYGACGNRENCARCAGGGFNYEREPMVEELAICAAVWGALDGCNPIGLLNGWARMASELHHILFGNQTVCESVNDHPIMLVMLDKLADLRGHELVAPGEGRRGEVEKAYHWIGNASRLYASRPPQATIKKLSDDRALALWYPGQAAPQDCYIELDIETGDVSAAANPEIGNAAPARVHYGIVRRYGIPLMRAEAANSLMEELRPLFARVLMGSMIGLDGQENRVAHLSQAAEEAEEEIAAAIDRFAGVLDAHNGGLTMMEAADWFDTPIADIAAGLFKHDDEEIAEMVERFEAEALEAGIILRGLEALIREWKEMSARAGSST